jgi:hypothetical protein
VVDRGKIVHIFLIGVVLQLCAELGAIGLIMRTYGHVDLKNRVDLGRETNSVSVDNRYQRVAMKSARQCLRPHS